MPHDITTEARTEPGSEQQIKANLPVAASPVGCEDPERGNEVAGVVPCSWMGFYLCNSCPNGF
jgi:hypothetical protein